MAFTIDDLVEISISGIWAGEDWSNVWQYRLAAIPGTVSAAQLGEAWWNNVKATYRALAVSSQGGAFRSVLVRSLTHLLGDYGEFAVPPGEQVGTRIPPAGGQLLPSGNAAGVRLTVATRVTRPGQKRFGFLVEDDTSSNDLLAPYLALLNSHMVVMAAGMVLGAPALLTDLRPVVTSKAPDGSVNASQSVTGFLRNVSVTTQVSRRAGHGI